MSYVAAVAAWFVIVGAWSWREHRRHQYRTQARPHLGATAYEQHAHGWTGLDDAIVRFWAHTAPQAEIDDRFAAIVARLAHPTDRRQS